MYDFERYHRVRIERVIDGDTLVLSFYLGLGIWLNEQPVRLLGINAPEMRGEEKEQGIAVKAFLEKLLRDAKDVIARTDEKSKGKYGRFLVTLLASHGGKWHNVNELLVSRGAAREYMAAGSLGTPSEEQREIFDTPAHDLEERIEVDDARTEEEVYNEAESDTTELAGELLKVAKEILGNHEIGRAQASKESRTQEAAG